MAPQGGQRADTRRRGRPRGKREKGSPSQLVEKSSGKTGRGERAGREPAKAEGEERVVSEKDIDRK